MRSGWPILIVLVATPLVAAVSEEDGSARLSAPTAEYPSFVATGEWPTVCVTLENIGSVDLTLANAAPWSIRDSFAHVVWAPIAADIPVVLTPGAQRTACWPGENQETPAEAVGHAPDAGWTLLAVAGIAPPGAYFLEWPYYLGSEPRTITLDLELT